MVESPKKRRASRTDDDDEPKPAPVSKNSSHPPTSVMVNSVIRMLNEPAGSSLQAIKKSVGGTYEVDIEKYTPYIKKYIKSAVERGVLIQTKGKGANGSFKIAPPSKSKAKAEGETKKLKSLKPRTLTK